LSLEIVRTTNIVNIAEIDLPILAAVQIVSLLTLETEDVRNRETDPVGAKSLEKDLDLIGEKSRVIL